MPLIVWSFLKKYYRYVIAGLALGIGLLLVYRKKDQYVRIWNKWWTAQSFRERVQSARDEAYLEIRAARQDDAALKNQLSRVNEEANEALRRRALIRLATEVRSGK